MLEAICGDWSTLGTMTCSADEKGGIIDCNSIYGWFVVFNSKDIEDDIWFPSREEAIKHFVEVMTE
jgi:hypothetical protein